MASDNRWDPFRDWRKSARSQVVPYEAPPESTKVRRVDGSFHVIFEFENGETYRSMPMTLDRAETIAARTALSQYFGDRKVRSVRIDTQETQ